MRFNRFAKFVLVLELLVDILTPFFRWAPLSYIAIFLYIFVNSICAVYFFKEEKKPMVRWLGFFIVMFCILTIINWARFPKYVISWAGEISTSHQMTAILKNLTTFFLIYKIRKQECITAKFLHNFAIILFLITMVNFIQGYRAIGYSQYGQAINVGYTILYLSFMVSLTGFNVKNTLLFVFMVIIILLSAKRGAIVSVGIVSVCFVMYRWANTRLRILIIPIAVAAMVFMVNSIYKSNANLQAKVEATQEGHSSGRDIIYETLWDNWKNQSIEEKIFGWQFAGSISILEYDGHNDYLEILNGQGLLGLFIYFCLIISFMVYFFRARSKLLFYEKFVVLSGVLVWYFRAFVSQTVYGSGTCYFMIAFTFVVSSLSMREEQEKLLLK